MLYCRWNVAWEHNLASTMETIAYGMLHVECYVALCRTLKFFHCRISNVADWMSHLLFACPGLQILLLRHPSLEPCFCLAMAFLEKSAFVMLHFVCGSPMHRLENAGF
eukprot:gnl/TRDRNA2_/TRDRNA2_174868_c1_seq14.p1 gnl/TRDRNA2_/TRDRNA2_174868_c1~~gnl/TRDRNA2_/TRDRNA2_174868_c1_seq14.p1  ORF type:complete len:108 (-),score=9.86 gnl/TRDRNA2_/TRDRNA2_174868_c1_seq14:12-335(-)